MTAREKLAAVQTRADEAAAALWSDPAVSPLEMEVRLAMSQADVPRLVTVLSKVLDEHDESDGQCSTCRDYFDNPQMYPCATVEHITATLAAS